MHAEGRMPAGKKAHRRQITTRGSVRAGFITLRRTAIRLPEGTTITFALAGNQNCGKTTLFNQLTGSNQHVGNFPGVTVDRKDGVIRGHRQYTGHGSSGHLFHVALILVRKSLPDNFCLMTSRRASSILWMQRISSGICI